MNDLSDQHRAMLDFEAGPHWRFAGARDEEIRRRFGLTPTAYAQRLNVLLDLPEALAYAPTTVNRVRRLRAARVGALGR